MATNQGFKSLRPGPRLNAKYLYHWIKSSTEYLQSLGNGATFKELSKRTTEQIPIPLPSLDEQRRIAAILDHADALRTKRRQVLARLDTLTQSIFHDMFGALTDSVPLSDMVAEFRYGTSNKAGTAGFPTLRIPNVIGGRLNLSEVKRVSVNDAELERLRLFDGDLLFVRSNGNPTNIGRCAVFTNASLGPCLNEKLPWIYASYLIRARLRGGVEPHFVAALMASSTNRRQLLDRCKTSAGQYNINIEGLGSIRVPQAATCQQRDFAFRTERLERHRQSTLTNLHAGDALFASLQARAFRGEL